MPLSSGVNLFAQNLLDENLDMRNPFVFPPYCLVSAVFKFLVGFKIPFTMVVPDYYPRPVWWQSLMGHVSRVARLCGVGDQKTLLFPSKRGYVPQAINY